MDLFVLQPGEISNARRNREEASLTTKTLNHVITMKIIPILFCTFLYFYFVAAKSLKCFNCFIDGPYPFNFLKPLGPVWNRCSGRQDDFADCNGGFCVEVMLYGNDISRYQILRSCTFNPEVCNVMEVGNSVHVGKCRTCNMDNCNNIYE